jgi:hypothetical protein
MTNKKGSSSLIPIPSRYDPLWSVRMRVSRRRCLLLLWLWQLVLVATVRTCLLHRVVMVVVVPFQVSNLILLYFSILVRPHWSIFLTTKYAPDPMSANLRNPNPRCP